MERERAFSQALGEGFSIEKLHDKEINVVLGADVVEVANMRVVQ